MFDFAIGDSPNLVLVQQVLSRSSDWIHVLGSDRSFYLVLGDTQLHDSDAAYSDALRLSALGISTVETVSLFFIDDQLSKTGVRKSRVCGWRLPDESVNGRILQILPKAWISRISNRREFLEVLLLDTWLKRTRRRTVFYTQTDHTLKAYFMPSGGYRAKLNVSPVGLEYHLREVYAGLSPADACSTLKTRIRESGKRVYEKPLEETLADAMCHIETTLHLSPLTDSVCGSQT